LIGLAVRWVIPPRKKAIRPRPKAARNLIPKLEAAMRKHIPHPVTRLPSPFAELDILHGGNESSTIEESLTVARDLREVLRDGENILYVNTLVNARRLDHIMGKRFDHGARRGRNHFVTYLAENFIDKLDVLRSIVAAKDIRYLILNGFELAAMTSRHRAMLMAWIRAMRNEGVNIILYTLGCPGRIGTLGALRFSARTINEVGAYLNEAEVDSEEQESVDPVEEAIEHEDFADLPDISKLYTGAPIPEPEHSDSESLKTKDLTLEMV
jgi:hypothetical protein